MIVGGGWAAWAQFGAGRGNSGADARYLTDVAAKKPFKLNVRERGTVDSLKSVTLTSKVEGTTTIISIVPEGTQVKEGDLLVELDASTLVETEKQQVIAVTQAKAALEKADQSLQIQKRQNESDVAAAQLALDLAVLDLEKFKSGDYLQQKSEMEGQVQVAKETLEQAEEVFNFSKRLNAKGYVSTSQLEKDRIAFTKAGIDLAAARTKLKVLEEFTFPRTIKELTEKSEESKRARDRVERQGLATLAQLEADFKAAELTNKVEEEKLARAQTQIANSKIYAPQAGEVVYATEERDRGEASEVIAAGATVRERKPLINLPDLTQMKVDTRIHESLVSRVREGLPARVRVDAVPGKIFVGKVQTISSVPVEGDWMRPDLKEYSCVVTIDYTPGEDVTLKPGLTAEVEIIVQERKDVLQVPFQSLVSAGKTRYAYVLTPDGPERREVVTGAANDTHVEILDGVAEGERVILNPRTHFGDELAEMDGAAAAEEAKAEAEAGGPTTSLGAGRDNAGPGGGPGGPGGGFGGPGGGVGGPGGGSGGPSGAGSPAGGPPQAGGRGGPGGGGQGGGRGGDPAQFFARLDKNGDGGVTSDEMPEFMASRFATMDANSDGKVDQAEFTEASKSFRPPGGGAGGPGGPGGGSGGPGGPRGGPGGGRPGR